MLRKKWIITSIFTALALLALFQPDTAEARRRKLVVNNCDFSAMDETDRIRNIYWPRGSGVSYIYSSRPWFGALLDQDGDGVFSDTVVVNQKAAEMVPGYINPADGSVKWIDPWSNLNDDLSPNTEDLAGWPDEFRVNGEPDIWGDQDIVVAVQDVTSNLFESTPLKLGIQYMTRVWAFKREPAKDFIFVHHDVINRSKYIVDTSEPIQTGPFTWKNCYFAQRMDPDVGASGNDDRSGYMRSKNLGFTFDRDFTDGGKSLGFMGVKILKTPEIDGKELGLTNWTAFQNAAGAYIVPEPTDDKTEYRIMSAAPGQVLDPVFDPNKEFQFSGIVGDARQLIVSGPFEMKPDDKQSLTFSFLFATAKNSSPKFSTDDEIIGELDKLVKLADAVQMFYDLGDLVKGAPTPALTLLPGDGQVTVNWDAVVSPSPNIAIVRYNIYRSTNAAADNYVLLGTFPHENGKAYSVVDKAPELINGWKVYYTITLADQLSGELGTILGTGIQEGLPTFAVGNSVIPRSDSQGLDGQKLPIRVVPNPFYAHAAWDNSPTEKHVQFINLPASCTIRVFTLSGNLVNVLQHSDGSGTENYNLRNRFGEPLASGIYYYVVTDSRGEKDTGKFIIVQ